MTKPAIAVTAAAALGLTGALSPVPSVARASAAAPADTPEFTLIDVDEGAPGSDPYAFTQLGDQVLFIATTAKSGRELWVTDGTDAGTRLVKEIGEEATGSRLSGLVAMGDHVFFAADDGVHGRELWRSDGTEDGTVLVADISQPKSVAAEDASSNPQELTVVGDQLLFRAASDEDGANEELWRSDGTTEGTHLVTEINTGGEESAHPSSPSELTEVEDQLFFTARSSGEAGSLLELWTTDGTEAGTEQLKVFPLSGGVSPHALTAVGDSVFFTAGANSTGGELWTSDGTEAGTVLVKNINTSSYYGLELGSYPRGLTDISGTLYFNAARGGGFSYDRDLWRSDGTEAGTTIVKDFLGGHPGSSPSDITAFGNGFLFADETGTAGQLWMSDGTEAGTQQVKEVPGNLSAPVDLEGVAYFDVDHGEVGRLWRTDGTAAGTSLVDGPIEGGLRDPAERTLVGDSIYLAADDGEHGLELWVLSHAEPTPPPSNAFKLQKGKTDKQKATIKLKVKVPGPGVAKLVAKGPKKKALVKSAKATAGKAKTLKILVKPNGKGKAKLKKQLKRGNRVAKLKVKVKVSYRPVGGTMRQQIKTYTLKKKRR